MSWADYYNDSARPQYDYGYRSQRDVAEEIAARKYREEQERKRQLIEESTVKFDTIENLIRNGDINSWEFINPNIFSRIEMKFTAKDGKTYYSTVSIDPLTGKIYPPR